MTTTRSSGERPEPTELAAAIADLTRRLPDVTVAGRRRIEALADSAAVSGERSLEATARYHLGRALIEAGHFVEATRSLDLARVLFEAEGDEIEATRVALGDVALYSLTGEPRRAIECGRTAIDHLTMVMARSLSSDELERSSLILAGLRSNLCMALITVGEYEEALHHSDAVIALADTLDSGHRGLVFSNRGYLLIEMGRPRLGLPWIERGSSILSVSDVPARVARNRAWGARAHAMLGNYSTSLSMLRQAQDDLAELPDAPDHHSISVDIARVFSMIGRSDDAIEILDDVVPKMVGTVLLSDRAAGLLLAGELLAKDDPVRARSVVLDARQLLDDAEHHRAAAQAALSLAESLPNVDHDDLVLVRDAIEHLESSGTMIDRVRWRVVAVEIGLIEDERERRAIIDDAEALAAGLAAPHLLWRLAFQRGKLEMANGSLEAARAAFSAATEILHRLRSNIGDEWLRSHFLAGRRDAVDSLCSVLLDLDLADEVIELLDGSYGITLAERVLADRPTDPTDAKAELGKLYDEMISADGQRLALIQPRVAELEDQAETDQRRALDSTLVVFGELDHEVFAVVVEPDQPARLVRRLTSVERLLDARVGLSLLQRRISARMLVDHRSAFRGPMLDILGDLHGQLIRPLGLAAPPTSNQLIIVPPPSAIDVPFGALHDGNTHVVEDVTVTLTPSPSVAAAVTARRRASRRPGLGHGPGPRTLAIGVGADGIPASVLEAVEIGMRTGGTAVCGDDATVERIVALMPSHEVIHVAAHSLSRSSDPWNSGLQLADRWITAAEISDWRLDGQIVVLSGCDTGLHTNSEFGGSGTSLELLGLPRAFLAAGASGVIATLSDLDDAGAIDFMGPLHDHLRTLPPDEAVRRTQLELLESGACISTWSSVAFVGGPSGS